MDTTQELAAFLRTRRERLAPAEAGLPVPRSKAGDPRVHRAAPASQAALDALECGKPARRTE